MTKSKASNKKTTRTLGRSELLIRKAPASAPPIPSVLQVRQDDPMKHDATPPGAAQYNATQHVTVQHSPTQYSATPQHVMQRNASAPLPRSSEFPYAAQIRIDAHLFDEIKNAVDSAILGGNYALGSASHFLREALREHSTGKTLTAMHQRGARKSTTLALDERLKNFWESLPKRHRQDILERAVRTKLLDYNS